MKWLRLLTVCLVVMGFYDCGKASDRNSVDCGCDEAPNVETPDETGTGGLFPPVIVVPVPIEVPVEVTPVPCPTPDIPSEKPKCNKGKGNGSEGCSASERGNDDELFGDSDFESCRKGKRCSKHSD